MFSAKIYIEEFSFDCIIGMLKKERGHAQKIVINMSLNYLYRKKKKDFCDYSEICNIIEKTMKKEKFHLLENALEFLKKKIESKYNVCNIKIKISKPNIIKNCVVSVEI